MKQAWYLEGNEVVFFDHGRTGSLASRYVRRGFSSSVDMPPPGAPGKSLDNTLGLQIAKITL